MLSTAYNCPGKDIKGPPESLPETLLNGTRNIFAMATLWHLRSGRAPTGARIKRLRKKKKANRGMRFLETRIGERKAKPKRSRGGNFKRRLLSIENINVSDPKTGKVHRVKLLSVKENDANPHYVRRNIITKGAAVETEIGLARITSRTGQHGITNAVLIGEKKPGK
jgi:small subunit ribosomal protein S8e